MTTTHDETAVFSDNALAVLENRYLRKNSEGEVVETPDGMFRRIAKNISEAEIEYENGSEQLRARGKSRLAHARRFAPT